MLTTNNLFILFSLNQHKQTHTFVAPPLSQLQGSIPGEGNKSSSSLGKNKTKPNLFLINKHDKIKSYSINTNQ